MKEIIEGGRADNKPDADFDPKQLEKGVKVEQEHTRDKSLAKEIAKDHLSEFPDYYDRLEKMEKQSADLEPEKINLKERWKNKEWNKLDGAPEEDVTPQNRLRNIASRMRGMDIEEVYKETPYANVDKFLLDLKDALASGNQQKIWDSYKTLANSVHWLGKALGIK